MCPPQGLLLYWSHRSHWPRASTKWGPPNITHLVFLLLGNTHFVKQIFRFQHYYFRLNISLFSSYLVFASSWPMCLILSVSLLIWAIKVTMRSLGLPNAEQGLGASLVFLAQGLPKAGEGPGQNLMFSIKKNPNIKTFRTKNLWYNEQVFLPFFFIQYKSTTCFC